jgi:aminopeptidase
MDPRIRAHAETIVDHSLDIEAGDDVLISAPPAAEDLVVALYAELGQVGAQPARTGSSARAFRAYLHAADPDDFETPGHSLAALEAADHAIFLGASVNVAETGDIPPESLAAYNRAHEPIGDAQLSMPFVYTRHPTSADAQQAEMSTETYADFLYGTVNKDWDEQRAIQQRVADRLEDADEVRIVAGESTDLSMSVAGMLAGNDFAEKNLPGGEVYTAPIPDSVEGEVTFDLPVVTQGREVIGARLVFEGGEVVEHEAEKNEDLLAAVLDTDAGARRLGELGIGMNRDIDHFTGNMLFDEKMGDTIHLALGRALEWTVPEGRECNESAVHLDMLVDMSEDARIEFDGEVVQRDGVFWFE